MVRHQSCSLAGPSGFDSHPEIFYATLKNFEGRNESTGLPCPGGGS